MCELGEPVDAATNPFSSLSVYPARRRSDGALTVLVVNKGADDVSTAVTVSGATATSAQVFQWTSGTDIRRAADLKATAGGVTPSFPAHSLTMLVLT